MELLANVLLNAQIMLSISINLQAIYANNVIISVQHAQVKMNTIALLVPPPKNKTLQVLRKIQSTVKILALLVYSSQTIFVTVRKFI